MADSDDPFDSDLARMSGTDLPESNEVRFHEQTSKALFHGTQAIEKGREVIDMHSEDRDVWFVEAVGPQSMQVKLRDGDGHSRTVHWPSEGGRYIPREGPTAGDYR